MYCAATSSQTRICASPGEPIAIRSTWSFSAWGALPPHAASSTAALAPTSASLAIFRFIEALLLRPGAASRA